MSCVVASCMGFQIESIRHGDRNASSAEVTGLFIKTTGQGGAAVRAVALRCQSVVVDLVPVAHNQRGMAVVAKGGVAFDVVHVAGVNVVQASFECDVAGGAISPHSLQGQFTARYFTGDQNSLIKAIHQGLEGIDGPPYAMGTVVPINTHGKTFYFVAMAVLNDQGTASTNIQDVQKAITSLWEYVRDSGELQELVVPVIGTARGRLKVSRKKVIEKIAESFVDASSEAKFTDRLIIMIHPDDAKRFKVNLHDIKDHLNHTLIRK